MRLVSAYIVPLNFPSSEPGSAFKSKDFHFYILGGELYPSWKRNMAKT